MGCGESKPALSLDDFKPSGEDVEAKVDKESIKALWDKKYSKFKLTDKELDELTPAEPITENDQVDKFPEFREKFLKLLEKKRSLQEKKELEFLKQYFRAKGTMAKKFIEIPNMMQIVKSGQDFDEVWHSKMLDWWESTGKTLLQTSFDLYDTDANGVLDTDEAAVFYKHMMEVQSHVVEDMISPVCVLGLKVHLYEQGKGAERTWERHGDILRVYGIENLRKDEDQRLQSTIEPVMSDLRCKVSRAVSDYKKNQAEKDRAAFAVMDVNGDGTLQVEEFLNTMMPLSDKYKEFWAALGFSFVAEQIAPEYM